MITTEKEWLDCKNYLELMHKYTVTPSATCLRTHVSDRKRRLAAVACCRYRVELSKERDVSLCMLRVAEKIADGEKVSHKEQKILEQPSVYRDTGGIEGACRWCVVKGDSSFLSYSVPINLFDQDVYCDRIRDILGNPFRRVSRQFGKSPLVAGCADTLVEEGCITPQVLSLARAVYGRRRKVLCRACSGEGCSGNIGYLDDPDERCDGSGTRWVDEEGPLDPVGLAAVADALEDDGYERPSAQMARLQHAIDLCGCTPSLCGDCIIRAEKRSHLFMHGADLVMALRGYDICTECSGWGVRSYVSSQERCVRCRGLGWVKHSRPQYRGFWALDCVLGK